MYLFLWNNYKFDKIMKNKDPDSNLRPRGWQLRKQKKSMQRILSTRQLDQLEEL